jgi:hypothetical protein
MRRLNLFAVIAAFTLIAAGIIPSAVIAASESPSSIEHTFQQAKKDYLDKNLDSAARQIQKGAAYMKAKAAKASVKGKKALDASAKELDKLADDVKKGAVTSVKIIEAVIDRAYVALAVDSQIKSPESETGKETAKAGDASDSITKDVEHSFAKIESGTKKAINTFRGWLPVLKEKGSEMGESLKKYIHEQATLIEKFLKKVYSK